MQVPDLVTVSQASKWVREIGLVGLLIAILFGLYRRWFYFAWQYNDMKTVLEKQIEELKTDRDRWLDAALTGHRVTSKAVSLAEKIRSAS